MKGPYWQTAIAALTLVSCVQLKPTTGVDTAGIVPSPSPSTGDQPTPAPFASATATPTAAPTPTPVPPPTLTLTSPGATTDFTASGVDIDFTAVPASGRTIASATVAYDGTILKTFKGPGTSFSLPGWNPNEANSVAATPDTTPVGFGDHKLTLKAVDDAGHLGSLDFAFHKPLKITGWDEETDLPAPTSHAQIFSDGASPPSFLNLWGSVDGNLDNATPRKDVYSFSAVGNGVWTSVAVNGTAVARAAYGACSYPNGAVDYLVGGRLGTQDLRELDVFTPLRGVAEQSSAVLATARHDPAVAYANGNLYVIGGTAGTQALYSVERVPIGSDLNPSGDFTAVSNTLNAVSGATAAVINGKIWLFGGGFKAIETYDTSKDAWTMLTDANGTVIGTPEGWSNSAMVAADGRYYFFGGTRQDGQAETEIWEFNPTTFAWRDLGPLPTFKDVTDNQRAETRMSAFFNDNHFYLVGGVSVPDGTVSQKVFRADLQ